MATSSTVTVDTVERTYEPRWHEVYASALKAGDTSVEAVEITDGESIIRRTHGVVSGKVEKHFESIEDRIVDADGIARIRKVNLTITYDKGLPAERTAAENLTVGFMNKLLVAGELSGLLSGILK